MTIIPMHNGGRGLTYQLLWSHHPGEQRVPANLFLTCRIYYSRIIKASEYDITLRSPSLPGDDICIKPDAVIIPTVFFK